MLKPPYAAAVTAVLVTLAGGPIGIGEAQARAIYTGTFDPRGDVYGFEGTHQFHVDDACLSSTGWQTANSYDGYDLGGNYYAPCGSVILTGGSLTLRKYASADKNLAGEYIDNTVVATSIFSFSEAMNDWDPALNWGDGIGGMQLYIQGIFVAFNPSTGRNELVGVDTPGKFGSFGLFDGQSWALEWVSGARPAGLEAGADSPPGVNLFGGCINDPQTGFSGVCNFRADVAPASATYTRVPEPGGLALVAAALLAAGLGSRRARRR